MLTIDFETYYTKEYSLSKMTTESYIRDPRFQVIGVSVKVDNGPIEWITGTHEEIKERLQAYDFTQTLAHNAVFDGAILSWVFDIHPKTFFDTLSMSRPLTGATVGGSLRALSEAFNLGHKGEEIYNTIGKRREDFTDEELARFGEYCRQDVNLTYKLFFKLLPAVTRQELYFIDMFIKMFTEPKIVLDKTRLETHLADVRAKKEALLAKVNVDKSELMSNPKFALLLQQHGVSPPMKTSPTTGKETYAFAKTDLEFKALLEHPDEQVQALVAARFGLRSTIEETRTENLIGVAERGPLPILLNYWGAGTGRSCLVGDTEITVLRLGTVIEIQLKQLLPDDLVWDGEAFVKHGGLIYQGIREVVSYQGVTGTPDHRVFVEEQDGSIELSAAASGAYTLKVATAS